MSEGGASLNSDFNRLIPEWVPQPIKARLLERDQKAEFTQQVKDELRQDLRIEKNNPPDFANLVFI